MCTELFLAILYLITISSVNYFLSKLLISYIKNIFDLAKLKNIFYFFTKTEFDIIFFFYSKKYLNSRILLININKFSTKKDILIIGNLYKYVLTVLEKNIGKNDYLKLLNRQYLFNKDKSIKN